MTLVLIKTFLAIVEAGSLVKASKRLNVTQSTVTARLKALEDDIGQPLVHRQKSGIRLTAPGIKFKRYAEAIANMWQQVLLETSLPTGMDSVCNLGCEQDLWPLAGRDLVRRLRIEHPATALAVRQGDSARIVEWLDAGLVDAALSYRAATKSGINALQIGNEKIILVSSRPDTSMRSDPLYVYFDAGPEFGREHAAEFSDAGVAKHSFSQAAWALDHVLDHGGSVYLPEVFARAQVEAGALHLIADAPVFSRGVYLLMNGSAATRWPWLPGMAQEWPSRAKN